MNDPILSLAHLAALRARLVTRERELAAQLRHTTAPAEAVDVSDFKELASDEALAAIDEAQGTQAVRELQDVQSALRRIDGGRYGICTECGEAIGERRLEVLPATAWCAECSRTQEAHLSLRTG